MEAMFRLCEDVAADGIAVGNVFHRPCRGGIGFPDLVPVAVANRLISTGPAGTEE